jgi:hypothetical protein
MTVHNAPLIMGVTARHTGASALNPMINEGVR